MTTSFFYDIGTNLQIVTASKQSWLDCGAHRIKKSIETVCVCVCVCYSPGTEEVVVVVALYLA